MQNHTDLSGIAFLLFGVFCLVCMDVIAKFLVTYDMHPAQILAIRSLFAVPSLYFIHKLMSRKPSVENIKRVSVQSTFHKFLQHPELVLRGVFGFAAPFCFFSALNYLSIADATVIFFASTFCTVLLSIFIFKENVGYHRWGALIIGFIGVFICINPTGDGEIKGYALVLFTSLVSAGIIVSGRYFTRKHSVSLVVLGINIGMGISGLLILPWIWQAMDWHSMSLILALSLCAICGHLMITTAFARTPASILAPFDYSALLWSILLGYVFWQDIPVLREWIGAFIIICSGVYIARREHRAKKDINSIDANAVMINSRTK